MWSRFGPSELQWECANIAGSSFTSSGINPDIDRNEEGILSVFRTGSTGVYYQFTFDTDKPGTFKFYENSTVTTRGTEIDIVCLNFNLDNIPESHNYGNDTVIFDNGNEKVSIPILRESYRFPSLLYYEFILKTGMYYMATFISNRKNAKVTYQIRFIEDSKYE